ncbi:MAG: hypothetical protein ACTJHK_05785 [Enterococcus viikkiensis]|uniref:Acetyltransferase n=1 Tax=Enterococcus viikkiensis TaxID=930854 RepID=A0ABU3FQ96_9ENTE|nr:hypothetical protein [Enterococcus viikkiensis]MDT2828153.1 hypothetical protein [Enterococcus viikkiensis]
MNRILVASVTIKQSMTVGKNLIVGSSIFLTKSLLKSVIVVGNPCRVLSKMTQQDKMDVLLRKK